MIDFGGPNVAKPMHVGHLRSSIIGDCLQRLYRANGWRVISDVHLGDWGLQMGQLISEIEHRGHRADLFRRRFHRSVSGAIAGDAWTIWKSFIRRASAACKADPARLEAARRATVELQAGRPGYRALWRHFVDVSEAGLAREFGSLGVHFDLWNGESSVDALIAPMIEDLKARGLAEISEGALVVPVARDDDKKPMPPLILVKSEGGVLYGTTDLATIIERVRDYDPDLILYVVDHRQHGHFEQVFRAARKAGLTGKAELEHVGYGTMNGADGKPFKTRAGGVMKLYDLIAMADGGSREAAGGAGHRRGLSAPRSAPRSRARSASPPSNSPISPTTAPRIISSTWSGSRKFEGKTGPYLQYAAVRIQSILRKARGAGLRCGRARHPFAGRARLVLQLLSLGDAHGGGGRQARAQHPVRLCLRPGAEFQPLLCRPSHPVGNGRGLRGRPAGALRPGSGGSDPGSGPSGHRSSRKNVSKSAGLAGLR